MSMQRKNTPPSARRSLRQLRPRFHRALARGIPDVEVRGKLVANAAEEFRSGNIELMRNPTISAQDVVGGILAIGESRGALSELRLGRDVLALRVSMELLLHLGAVVHWKHALRYTSDVALRRAITTVVDAVALSLSHPALSWSQRYLFLTAVRYLIQYRKVQMAAMARFLRLELNLNPYSRDYYFAPAVNVPSMYWDTLDQLFEKKYLALRGSKTGSGDYKALLESAAPRARIYEVLAVITHRLFGVWPCLFGSAASGLAGVDSDLDIVVLQPRHRVKNLVTMARKWVTEGGQPSVACPAPSSEMNRLHRSRAHANDWMFAKKTRTAAAIWSGRIIAASGILQRFGWRLDCVETARIPIIRIIAAVDKGGNPRPVPADYVSKNENGDPMAFNRANNGKFTGIDETTDNNLRNTARDNNLMLLSPLVTIGEDVNAWDFRVRDPFDPQTKCHIKDLSRKQRKIINHHLESRMFLDICNALALRTDKNGVFYTVGPNESEEENSADICIVPIDISFYNEVVLYNTRLLKSYAEISPLFTMLAVLMKHWTKCREISHSFGGTLSGYQWTLMLLHFLQHYCDPKTGLPLLPNLQSPPPALEGELGAPVILNNKFDVSFLHPFRGPNRLVNFSADTMTFSTVGNVVSGVAAAKDPSNIKDPSNAKGPSSAKGPSNAKRPSNTKGPSSAKDPSVVESTSILRNNSIEPATKDSSPEAPSIPPPDDAEVSLGSSKTLISRAISSVQSDWSTYAVQRNWPEETLINRPFDYALYMLLTPLPNAKAASLDNGSMNVMRQCHGVTDEGRPIFTSKNRDVLDTVDREPSPVAVPSCHMDHSSFITFGDHRLSVALVAFLEYFAYRFPAATHLISANRRPLLPQKKADYFDLDRSGRNTVLFNDCRHIDCDQTTREESSFSGRFRHTDNRDVDVPGFISSELECYDEVSDAVSSDAESSSLAIPHKSSIDESNTHCETVDSESLNVKESGSIEIGSDLEPADVEDQPALEKEIHVRMTVANESVYLTPGSESEYSSDGDDKGSTTGGSSGSDGGHVIRQLKAARGAIRRMRGPKEFVKRGHMCILDPFEPDRTIGPSHRDGYCKILTELARAVDLHLEAVEKIRKANRTQSEPGAGQPGKDAELASASKTNPFSRSHKNSTVDATNEMLCLDWDLPNQRESTGLFTVNEIPSEPLPLPVQTAVIVAASEFCGKLFQAPGSDFDRAKCSGQEFGLKQYVLNEKEQCQQVKFLAIALERFIRDSADEQARLAEEEAKAMQSKMEKQQLGDSNRVVEDATTRPALRKPFLMPARNLTTLTKTRSASLKPGNISPVQDVPVRAASLKKKSPASYSVRTMVDVLIHDLAVQRSADVKAAPPKREAKKNNRVRENSVKYKPKMDCSTSRTSQQHINKSAVQPASYPRVRRKDL